MENIVNPTIIAKTINSNLKSIDTGYYIAGG